MTNTTTPMRGYLHTIALAQAHHPRIWANVAKGAPALAREALTLRIKGVLQQAADRDERTILQPVILAAADALNSMPGPLLLTMIDEVVEAMIPND